VVSCWYVTRLESLFKSLNYLAPFVCRLSGRLFSHMFFSCWTIKTTVLCNLKFAVCVCVCVCGGYYSTDPHLVLLRILEAPCLVSERTLANFAGAFISVQEPFAPLGKFLVSTFNIYCYHALPIYFSIYYSPCLCHSTRYGLCGWEMDVNYAMLYPSRPLKVTRMDR
jgi:hypothetical protein